jgi:hypothetical protein
MTALHQQRQHRGDVRSGSARWPLIALIAAGLLIEAVLIAGWLVPLSLWRTPTNLPAGAPLVLILGQDRAGALRFLLPVLVLVGVWGVSLAVAWRCRSFVALVLSIAFTTIFLITLLPMNPAGTQDIYHNVSDGRLFWLHGVNPTIIPPLAFPEDAFVRHVWGYVDLPSAYGPLWYFASGIPTALAGDDLIPNLVAQKSLVAAFLLGTVLLVAVAARAVAHERAVFAIVLVGWCPLLLWESAGNGHNDSLMAFFLTAAFVAAARRAYLWVLPALALSVLVKYTTALVVPVALIWLLRRPDVQVKEVAGGALIAVLLTVLAIAPMYEGAETIAALRRPGMTFILSPGTLAHGLFTRWLDDAPATRLVQAATGVLFVAGYGVTMYRCRGGPRDLADRSFDALFLYLLLVSWWYWPWYLTWLAPAAALGTGLRRPIAFAVMAAGSLLTYLYWWPDPPWQTTEWYGAYIAITAGVFAAPAIVWLWPDAWLRRRYDGSIAEAPAASSGN